VPSVTWGLEGSLGISRALGGWLCYKYGSWVFMISSCFSCWYPQLWFMISMFDHDGYLTDIHGT
jgi:hypothetical protein